MPEGNVLHGLAREINDHFRGHRVHSSSPQGRFAGADLLDGARLAEADTWGKHLFVSFAGLAAQVHIHLGIYGKVRFTPGLPPVVGQVRWRLCDEATTMDVRGPNACELVDPDEMESILDRLGPDPLRADAVPERFTERVLRSRAPIATLLMDQSVIAGAGNIYRAEVLYRQGLDPLTLGTALRPEQARAIWDDLVELMARGLDGGRIDTVRPEHEPEAMGRPPRVDDHGGEVYVYRRQGQACLVCGAPILTSTIGGRNLFWCPNCQRP
ncbi:endonuclease-8 [Ruaniaceae bacterium KH17]|nr:endonuclease-8 [Ruaniaceae bacterium KH17]